MAQALTLTEAAERLAPIFDESEAFSAPAKQNGKWMSLDSAGDILAGRVNGKQPALTRQRAEITVQDAARQIEARETPEDLAEIRAARIVATATKLQRLAEFQDFMSRAALPFEGMDETTALASPEFMTVYGLAQQTRAAYEAALREEFDAWDRQCRAENDIFDSGRPEWSEADTNRVGAVLMGLGVSEQEITQLWMTPTPINVSSPACLAIAQMATGIEGQDALYAALGLVGFDNDEIGAAMSGEAPVFLRDHRIQELVARAVDAYTTAENRRAA